MFDGMNDPLALRHVLCVPALHVLGAAMSFSCSNPVASGVDAMVFVDGAAPADAAGSLDTVPEPDGGPVQMHACDRREASCMPAPSWSEDRVETASTGEHTGYAPAITVDKEGGIHIAYLSDSGLSYAYKAPERSLWVTELVTAGGDPLFRHAALLVDDAGSVHI